MLASRVSNSMTAHHSTNNFLSENTMNDQSNQYQQLIAKCWADEAFKQRLLDNPAETLKAEGMALPEGVRVQVVENTAQDFTLVIPPRPTELSDEELDTVPAGASFELQTSRTNPETIRRSSSLMMVLEELEERR
jgi:hypothetical protein